MVGSLANHDFRNWAKEHPNDVETAFKCLCTDDKNFVRAIENTTKTPENTRIRFEGWYSIVNKISGIAIELPNIKPE